MPSTLVIHNPFAGHGRAKQEWPLVEKELRSAGLDFDLVSTQRPREATALAEQAGKHYATVIGAGGDGTFHEIVNGLLCGSHEQETPTLGLVPLGNGDDFSKMIPPETPIGGKAFHWQVAVQKIARGQSHLFDIGRIVVDEGRPRPGGGTEYFLNGMDVGFGAQVARNFTTVPYFLTGIPAYFAAIATTLRHYAVPRLHLRVDDEPPVEQRSTMTVVANGRCFAGGFWIAPEARADDGWFDVLIAEGVGRAQILRMIPKIMKGTHTHEPILRMVRARRIVIDSPDPLVVEADGEIPFLEAQHLEVEILPQRLRVIV